MMANNTDMFYRQIIAEQRLPFQPVVAPTLEEQLTAAIAKKYPKSKTRSRRKWVRHC
ncbi:MAG: hypothetical protein FWC75_04680 [Oscillospiraceae bacterium]|nr:hypothetical protein [Oscillospiraceae bacterium]